MASRTVRKSSGVTFPMKDFKTAYAAAARAVPSRTPAPVLLNVKLTIADGVATLLATNFEVWISHRLPCDPGCEPFAVLLDHSTFTNILRVAKGEKIIIHSPTEIGGKLKVEVGSRSWQVTTHDPTRFPDRPGLEMPSHLEVDAAWLATAIKRTLKESRPGAMEGYATASVEFEPMLSALGVSTFNGRSLAHQEIPASPVGTLTFPSKPPILQDTAVRLLQGLLSGVTEPVKVGFPTASHALFVIGDTTALCRLAEGKFFNWRTFLSQFGEPSGSVVMPCKTFREALGCAAVSLDDETRAVDMRLIDWDVDHEGKGMMYLESNSHRGESNVREPVDWRGEEVEVSIDPQYIQNMLAAIGDDTPLTMSIFKNRRIPMKLKTEDGFLGLVQYIVRDE